MSRDEIIKKGFERHMAAVDKRCLEVLTDYPLLFQTPDHAKRIYQTEASLFFPKHTAINPENLGIETFYRNLSLKVRMQAPGFGFRDFLEAENSLIKRHQEILTELRSDTFSLNGSQFLDEARLFGCAFVEFFMKRLGKLKKKCAKILRNPKESPDQRLTKTLQEAFKTLDRAYRVLSEWRLIIYSPAIQKLLSDPFIISRTSDVDEYCSIRYRDGLAECSRILQLAEPVLTTAANKQKLQIRKVFIRLEKQHCRNKNFLWIDETSSAEDRELHLVRRSELKKGVQTVLYLDMRAHPIFAIQKQVGAMMAAAVAGLWAVFAQIMILQHSAAPLSTNGVVSSGGFVLVTALTLAYVLKDRIKELGRAKFRRGILGNIPDTSESLYYRDTRGKAFRIGKLREFAQHASSKTLSPRLRQALSKVSVSTEHRTIIQYRKHLVIHSQKSPDRIKDPLEGLHDILRFNLESLTKKLDDPEQKVLIVKSNGENQEVILPKVYHLDIHLAYRLKTRWKWHALCEDILRVVLDKNGIVRIQRLTANGPVPAKIRPAEIRLQEIDSAS